MKCETNLIYMCLKTVYLKFFVIPVITFTMYSFICIDIRQQQNVINMEIAQCQIEIHEIEEKIRIHDIKIKKIAEEKKLAKETERKKIFADVDVFLRDIRYRESTNNYDTTNSLGYLGAYQFSMTLIKNLGYKNITKEEFLSSPELQDEVMLVLIKHHKFILRKYIEKYDGKEIYGIKITESGLLAGAHIAGAPNIITFLNTGRVFTDAYGTKITDYIEEFAFYNVKT